MADGSDVLSTRRKEAETLGHIGQALYDVDVPRVSVQLPRDLAEAAVKAWQRDDDSEITRETYEERTQRNRAGTLALIGLEITDRGRWEEDLVHVDLSADLIGRADSARDDLATASTTEKASRAKAERAQVFAVIRYDRYLGGVTAGADLFSVKEVWPTEKDAVRETDRLNREAGDAVEYSWAATRFFPEGLASITPRSSEL